MSKIVPTKLGRFNAVKADGENEFLFECPDCGEWLPMSEEILNGSAPIDHQSRTRPATFCSFAGTREFGVELVAAMQARLLVDGIPYDPGQSV